MGRGGGESRNRYFMNSAAIFIGSSTRQRRSRSSWRPSQRAADQILKRGSDIRSKQFRRRRIARPRAAPKESALREQRTALGVRPTLDLLIAEVREVGRQVVDFLLVVSSLQTEHVIIGVRGDWIGGIACAVEGNAGLHILYNRRIETTMCSDRFLTPQASLSASWSALPELSHGNGPSNESGSGDDA